VTVEPLAMFPLSTVVFPFTELPLHVFEVRYQHLTRDVLLGSKEFGICLISRGWEVGGHDERVDVGTRVRVELAAPLEEDRWILVTRGIERFRVTSWLDDAPYPRALVLPEPVADADVPRDVLESTFKSVKALRRIQSEFSDGWTSPCVDLGLDEDSSAAAWMLCAMSPLTLVDLQLLLEVPDHRSRLTLLRDLCDAKRSDLETAMRLDDAT
jgi:hypothetical protein